ncbi:chaplin [Streptomyces sp. V4-01]|uniref:Chaplin n=1 Tax=Actinacidiphila polyblastidii TaxID=3110430 RepID=A0ABU7P847_9ACTN|nr:chaplin [Streptomyces sp. V4-01]
MRQILSRGVLTVAAASSILAVSGGYASADSDGNGTASGSPGLLSGNSVSVPVEAPVNVCGNSVDGAAALNPAFGNTCVNGAPPAQPPASPRPAAPAPQAPPRQREVPPAPHAAPVHEVLAETGFGGAETGAAAAAAAALLLGGALLYRRSARTAPARSGRASGGHARR